MRTGSYSSSPTIYTVNSTGGGSSGSGDSGTLPYVIGQANTNTNTAGSEIQFDKTVFESPQTITLTSSTLVLSETAGPEVISGPGASRLTVSSSDLFLVVRVNSGVTATLAGLTIAHGGGQDGGGVYNAGTLNVSHSAIDNNFSSGGGGIFNVGMLTVSDSTISDNHTSAPISTSGGGIENMGGDVRIVSCTIANNTSTYGGGIRNENGADGRFQHYRGQHSRIYRRRHRK